MNLYEKYKQSGIDWIGDIPISWDLKKIKYKGKTLAGGTPATGNPDYWDGDIPWLNSGKVQNNIIILSDVDKYITQLGLNESATKLIKSNSVLVALTGATCGNIGYLTFKSSANQSIVAIENDSTLNSKFLFYFLLSQREQILIEKSGGAQSGINERDVKNLFLCYPPLSDQTAIANFLDEKTAQLDKLISNKQKLIELLKEERTTIINEAVSGGGKNWEKKKLKYISKLRDELISNSDFKIAVENIESESGRLVDMLEEKNYEGQLSAFKKEDIIFNKLRPYLHKVYFAETDGGLFGELLIIYSKGELIPEFLFYKLFSKHFIDVVDGSTQGSKMPRANWEFMGQQLISFPIDKEEQIRIVQNINQETQKMDKTISKVRMEIQLMKEYKIALISEVVTGKLKII